MDTDRPTAGEAAEAVALLGRYFYGNPDHQQHYETLMEVHQLYVERDKSYGDVWRNYGALPNLLSAARKADRLMEVWWYGDGTLHKDALDDALDAINYLTFFIRNVRDANMKGVKGTRPVFDPNGEEG